VARRSYDYTIIGSGIAGLNTALLAQEHGSVLTLTKGRMEDCDALYHQGGPGCRRLSSAAYARYPGRGRWSV
jgi:aspartate oxidase